LKQRRDWLLILGIAYLVGLTLFALFGPNIRDFQLRNEVNVREFSSVYTPVTKTVFTPSNATVPLGTDEIGRDIVARLAAGARISLFVGFVVQAISLVVGVTVGVLGVMAPKWLRNPIMRFTDGMFAFPDILLAILIIGVIGQGLGPVIAALAITGWPSIARLVATQVATLKDREFVVASKATGASTFYLVTRHILPQTWSLLLAVSMVEIAGTILAESTLSFLGIGVQAPDPSWGSMINNARPMLNSYPLVLLWPCLVLSLTVFALNFVGDGLRTYLDPKRRRS
jgi:ABC-type dipeptide/oligopeptide/nickel transport system permease subunit